MALDQAPAQPGPSPIPVPGPTPGPNPPSAPGPGPDPAAHARHHAVAHVAPERYGRDFTLINQEVLQHLPSLDSVDLHITVDIRAHLAEGFPEDKVRVIMENARALKFDQSAFESD